MIAEHLELDWHAAKTDDRLVEIGMGSWGGRYYPMWSPRRGRSSIPIPALLKAAPDGESYPQLAARLAGWLADTDGDAGDRLVIMHGMSSRVLRGVMTGANGGRHRPARRSRPACRRDRW